MAQGYTDEEWNLLANTPLAVAAAVALAEPGGGRRETEALLRAWRDGAELFPNSAVVQRLVRDFDPEERQPEPEPRRDPAPATPRHVLAEAVDHCGAAVELLDRGGDALELDAYQRFVLHIAAEVARADGEGGLLGLGAVAVSLDERDVLRAIRVGLGYTPPELRL